MKKTIIISSLLAVFFSCTDKNKKEFEGYVYYDNKPLKNVIVYECFRQKYDSTKTNKIGYFRLKRFSQTSAYGLIFKKEGFITDTVSLTRGRDSPPVYKLFLRERKDTLFMKPTNNNKSKE